MNVKEELEQQAEQETLPLDLDPEQTGDEQAPASQPEATEDDGEVVVTIGEEAPPPDENRNAPEWVRELRKNHRELQRKNRELEDKLKTYQPAAPALVVGQKPTLEQFDYDTEKFEAELAAWFDRRRKADEEAARLKAEEAEQQKAWQNKLDTYAQQKTGLKVKDFDDAEAFIQETLNVVQQGVILQGAENSALVVLALGKNPAKAKELASITDPVKFAFAVAKLEAQLKVTNRKAPPPPEKTLQGTARVSGTVDSTLERLREEAARTGDMTKVIAYKRQKRS
jgi:hypothetical protein